MPLASGYTYSPASKPANPRGLVRHSDGDTLVVEQPLRLVSCDTTEKAQYAGAPAISQPKLDRCRQRLESGFYDAIPAPLRSYLVAKLTSDAAQRHITAATEATAAFDALLDQRLVKPDGTRRRAAVIPTGEIVDRYGRMLAYVAPWFAGPPGDPLPPKGDPARRTLNLDMIANGWAAFFPVYPSLPALDDMRAAVAAAEAAWNAKLGAWQSQGAGLLLGYEYRACIKLAQAGTAAEGIADAFQRSCVDLATLTIVGKFGFSAVPPSLRLWVWEADIARATADLGLH
jgi:endonuclease YncB( thermonuclease family)